MSTSYYRLRPPVTSVRVESAGHHDRVHVWVEHGLAGALVVPKDCTPSLLLLLSNEEMDDSKVPLRTLWGGDIRGTIVQVNDPGLPDGCQVVSEYGEVFTVGAVKARQGVRRTDGMPTELFGYEPSYTPGREEPT